MTSYTTLYYRCFPSWDAMLLCCEKSRNYRHSWRFQISIGKKLINVNKWKCWVYQTFCQLIFESTMGEDNSYSFHNTAALYPMIEIIYSKANSTYISGWRFKWRFFIRCNILILKFYWYYFMILMDAMLYYFQESHHDSSRLAQGHQICKLGTEWKGQPFISWQFFSLMLIFHQNAVQYIINAFIVYTCFWYWA